MRKKPVKLSPEQAEARNALVAANLGLARHIAQMMYQTIPCVKRLGLQDAEQEGALGLMDAATPGKYDPAKAKFSTYAGRAIFNHIYAAAWGCGVVRAPYRSSGKSPHLREKARRAWRACSLPRLRGEDFAYEWEPAAPEGPSPGDREELALRQEALAGALERLTPVQRDALRARGSRQDGETLADVGRRHGFCRERARQIQAAALTKLRGWLAPRPLP